MKIERAEKILQLQLDWVKTADAKVPALFAINISMLGVLSALAKAATSWSLVSGIFVVICASLLIYSIGNMAFTMFPSLLGPNTSNLYFGGIAKQSNEDFHEKIKQLSDDEYLDDLINQAYRNAEIAKSKYGYIKKSSVYLLLSFPIWLLSIYLIYT
ncbi:hypothetical protein FGD67_03710 [Colwellia sp. M166]|uniref:Pycsar system effector family protein n=1 Tax=Colwellia sp. M166 TaxID=2583805 RepID=UPI00211EDD0C|nr:Pycsar system effector family protein [Colwellia sp. M166]UUO22414.1 hypothetical protein FGD67_03710 [Colwellia sp. M166]|tara:strand:- start:439 stop:909 length:471 start_codon:yes stop_codon:yes gene_type:complete